MARILKKGLSPTNRYYICTCNSCRSVIEFLAIEGVVDTDFNNEKFIRFKCPVCQSDVFGRGEGSDTPSKPKWSPSDWRPHRPFWI